MTKTLRLITAIGLIGLGFAGGGWLASESPRSAVVRPAAATQAPAA